MLVLQKGLILPVPMYGGSYFFIQPFFALQPQLVLWYIHNQSKPLPIITMPEHLIIRIFEPRIICLGVICLILILRVS